MRSPRHLLRESALDNPGYALCACFEQSGRSELLAEAISVMREAV
jgi:hypothetical protein